MTGRTLRTALLPLAVLGVTGCGLVGPDEARDAANDLRLAYALWTAQGIEDYDLTVEERCFCASIGPIVLRVRDGVRSEAVPPAGYVGPSIEAAAVPDVPELFGFIDDAIDRRAHRIRVVYHPTLGYPTEISIDYSENIVDEERGYEAQLSVVGGTD